MEKTYLPDGLDIVVDLGKNLRKVKNIPWTEEELRETEEEEEVTADC